MKEEILVLLLGITALALVTVHAYKEFTTPTECMNITHFQ